MLLTQTFTAGQTKEFREAADFFRLLKCTSPVNVKLFRQGAIIEEMDGVEAGYAERWKKPFDSLQITSPLAQSVQFVMRFNAEAIYDNQVFNAPASTGAFAQTVQTINTASATISAANSNRKYFALHNTSANVVYINLSGAACTVANGIAINPGQFFVLDQFLPSGAITAIATVNSDVVEIEG